MEVGDFNHLFGNNFLEKISPEEPKLQMNSNGLETCHM